METRSTALGQIYAGIPTIARMYTGLCCEIFPCERDVLRYVLMRALYCADLGRETSCRTRGQTGQQVGTLRKCERIKMCLSKICTTWALLSDKDTQKPRRLFVQIQLVLRDAC